MLMLMLLLPKFRMSDDWLFGVAPYALIDELGFCVALALSLSYPAGA